MPIRLEELRARTPPELIGEDRLCRGCSYNLRGLRDNGKCPECGKPIKLRDLARFADRMVDAPLSWLRTFRLGTLLLFLGGWGMAGGLMTWALLGHVWCALGALGGSIAWAAGTVLTTRPRPRTPATQIDPDKEWVVWRAWARASQPMWTLALGGAAIAQATDQASPITVIPIGALMLAGLVGWWPLMMIQSNLAYWASDTDLSVSLRHASWSVGIGLGLGAGVCLVIGRGWIGNPVMGIFFFGAWAGPICVSLGYILLALLRLWRLGCWVTLSHMHSVMKDERLRERATAARVARGGM